MVVILISLQLLANIFHTVITFKQTKQFKIKQQYTMLIDYRGPIVFYIVCPSGDKHWILNFFNILIFLDIFRIFLEHNESRTLTYWFLMPTMMPTNATILNHGHNVYMY